MKIVITQEDVKNADNFNDVYNCALAKVMQRILNDDSITVGTESIGFPNSNGEYAKINPPFEFEDYCNLLSGKIKEFVTEYTPL